MTGAIIQMGAMGIQDIYLSGNPQITFFKSVYKRHTSFAVESIQIVPDESVTTNSKVSLLITRNGDLLKRLWIQFNPQSTYVANTIASDFTHSLINEVEILIGGFVIDRHYGKWLTVWRDLTELNPYALQASLTATGGVRDNQLSINYDKMSYNNFGITGNNLTFTHAPSECYIPLQFWFCRNPGLALPLIALQYHDVRLNITFSHIKNFLVPSTGMYSLDSVKIFADYIFLSDNERKFFVENNHKYLIEQVQLQHTSGTKNIKLKFVQPVKEIIFTGTPTYPTTTQVNGGATNNFIVVDTSGMDTSSTTRVTAQLIFNGSDQFKPQNLKYFTRKQIWDHHTGNGKGTYGVYGVYSFALFPEEHQPSGTCNFSRMNDTRLVFNNFSTHEILNPLDIYAINYNIMNITGGMGGLLYGN
jgi:hypothetical protein